MAKRYSKEFKERAVERLKRCDKVRELAKELGVNRRLLYKWREQLLERVGEGRASESSREYQLRQEVSKLKRVLADKTLEVDFFRGALQKVAARRQQSEVGGEPASTTRSGK